MGKQKMEAGVKDIHLNNIRLAVASTRKDVKIYPCHKCCNGKYIIDILLVYDSSNYYSDENETEFTRSLTLIDFIDDDTETENRDREICKCLYAETRDQGKVPNISILHIGEEDIGTLYAFAMPVLTGMETGICYGRMCANMNYRCVYMEEAGMETIDEFNLSEPSSDDM